MLIAPNYLSEQSHERDGCVVGLGNTGSSLTVDYQKYTRQQLCIA